MEIRTLTEADVEVFWQVRLRGLRENPEAFGSSYEESVKEPMEQVAGRLRPTPDKFTLGAFEGEALLGMVGFGRSQYDKERHKGQIWGMYSLPEARGQGLGKKLMQEAIVRASAMPGLEQINLIVAANNPAARGLYLSLGFQPYGLEKRALKMGDQYIDEEFMTLWLEPIQE